MRIAFTSDIHVDMSRENHLLIDHMVERLQADPPDVFVLCGDISPLSEVFASALTRFHPAECKKLLVTGNHDVWIDSKNKLKRGIDSTIKYTEILPRACQENDFYFLGVEPFRLGSVGFAGCMGWYDYSFRNTLFEDVIREDTYRSGELLYGADRPQSHTWNDKQYAWWLRHPGKHLINLKSRAVCRADSEICNEMISSLAKQLGHLESTGIERIIVVTHFLSFRELVIYKNELPIDFFTAYDGSMGMEEVIRSSKRVTHALSGHSHTVKDRVIGSIRAMASPVGYLSKANALHLPQLAEERLIYFSV